MNAPSASLSAGAPHRWRLPAVLTAGMLLALAAIFWPTLASMIAIWERSETFAHGYLIFPISAWLIWRMRGTLAQIPPRTDSRGLFALALAGAAWLLADAGSVNVVAQYAFVAMLVATVWTLLGAAFVRAAFFPLMFLFFAVPVGEFLIQPLMGVTADFTVAMLQLTGIPVYREGMFFSIPSGDWSVVEGCSGLRYLIASVTLGVLYAYLTFRSWKRRLLFSVAAVVVPVFANSGRAFMIVMIAHLSDMKLALGVDHYIYGWVFFGFVMLLLFWIGSFWREDDRPQTTVAPAVPAAGGRSRPLPAMALAALAVAAVWPAWAQWLASRPLPPVAPLQVEAPRGWQPVADVTDWVPHWVGADREFRRTYAQDGQPVLLALHYYVTQRQGAELVNSQNVMARQKHPQWSIVGETRTTVDVGGQPRAVRQARLRSRDGQRLLVWQWNRIDGGTTVNDHYAKLALALDRIALARDDGLSVLIATPYDTADVDAARATLARFAAAVEPALVRTLAQADGP